MVIRVEAAVGTLNMQHPTCWENTSTIITQRRIEVCLEKKIIQDEKNIMPAFTRRIGRHHKKIDLIVPF